jgi:hypothetical protein
MSQEEKFQEYESKAIQTLRYPRALARVLRDQAELNDGYANAHANSGSVWPTADGGHILKKDVYANTAKMFRDAADIFDPPKPCK